MDSVGDLQRVLVIIPTYNERENLEIIVDRVRAAVPTADILIADDASPDGTGEIADELAARDEQVHVLHRSGKQGLGAAYVAGFGWGLERDFEVLVEMDADGSHQPEELPRLLGALEHSDLAIGSRWVRGGEVQNWPKNREVLSRGANTYARLMLGIPVRDSTGGFRAYRATTLRKIGIDDVTSQGYCFQVDLTLRTVRCGLQVAEVPITFVERERGNSKMSRDIIVEAFRRVTGWGVAYRLGSLTGRRR
ncbi:polyprenol monophosphomannose synthase [Actinoallomurus liliacearum]|uniref:Polyprenol monophosphomannose synthase n=1 Tax=Actinoallomurus liliacearum TaxID=1080073 RepID=A0ABP8TIC9_9ACTN